ncbi:MAG: xanthine dehydrogenase family protein molybdopterin-binding subunit, partial [Deltaproteobacteria bacterium]|nr:xanthine dehydrogenase family protein molybdopterin-binding subunit [Deltaproteobacteria bacterium]
MSERACWVGDEMGAAVAAETEEIAGEALRLMEIEWEVLPFVLDYQEAMKPGGPIIHPEINPQGNVLPPDPRGERQWEEGGYMPAGVARDVFVERGEVPIEEALAQAEAAIEVRTVYAPADHACLDSMGCLIIWDDDQLTCWTNAYQGDQTRLHIAQMLGLPLNKVRVILTYVGASMGRWNVGDQTFFIYTALLARKSGRPVKFKHTRREDFHDTRQHIDWTCKLGAKKDGTITAASFYGLGDCGAYAEHIGCILKFIPLEIDLRATAHIPNVKMEGYGTYTNKIPGGMMRCTGNIQFNLPLGIGVDMLAEKLKMDPLDLTLKNFGHKWGGLPDESLAACLREGAQRIGWERRGAPGQGPVYEGAKRRGLGFSFHNGWHAEWEEVPRGSIQVKVKLNPDGTVILDAPFAETGCGSASCNVFS